MMLRIKRRAVHTVDKSSTTGLCPTQIFISLLEISSYNYSTYLLPHLGTSEGNTWFFLGRLKTLSNFHLLILIVRIIKMPTSEGTCEAEMK